MSIPDAMRRALLDLDVDAVIALAPHLPKPVSREAAVVQMHMARIAARSLPERARLYSHRWLAERGYRSLLPDGLRARPERIGAGIATSVGIASLSTIPEVRARIVGVMSDAAREVYADTSGEPDPVVVRTHMLAARARERRGLMLP